MYVNLSSSHPETLFQGDIIRDFPFFILDHPKPVFKEDGAFKETSANTRIYAVETRKDKVIILSQTCDIQRRKNVMVCPIYTVNLLEEDDMVKQDKIKSLRKRQIGYWYYLPKLRGVIEESFADLQTIQYVPRRTIEKFRSNRLISLTDLHRHRLSWSLVRFFGRPH